MPIHAHPVWAKRRVLFAASAAAAAAAFATAVLGGVESPRAAGAEDPCQGSGKRAQIATAKLIIEYNATDDDIGVHGAFDDQGWSKLCVYSPDGRPLLTVSPGGASCGISRWVGSSSSRGNLRPTSSRSRI